MNTENKTMTMWDLQLFADASAQLQNTTSTTGMKPELKIYYVRRLIELAEPKLVHDQFGDSYPIPANNGKTIEFRKYDSLPKATTPLTEGVTPEGQAMNVTTITAEVKQYGGWVPVTDVLQMAALDSNIVQATKLLASQAGRTLDTIVRDIMAGGTNVIYAPKIATGGTITAVTSRSGLDATAVLTPDLIFQAATVLSAMNTDTIGDSYVAIIHPYVAYDLMRNEEWIDVHKYADPEAIYNGEIGKLGNVRFVESSEAKIWKDSSCPSDGDSGYLAVFGTIVLGAHAYASTELEGGGLEHIVKQLGYGDDPLNQRASVGWKASKTAERLVEQYMVRIESTSAYSKKGGRKLRKEQHMATTEKKPEQGQKMVKIKLFKGSGKYADDVFVGLNGETYKIQRGVEVEVPEGVAEILEHSAQQDAMTAEKQEKLAENAQHI